jgi:WD40 repeat protein
MGAERGLSRRAVTIGVEQFEGDYERLPFAPELVTEFSSALAALGYETTTRAETELASAALGAEVREQLGAAGADGLLIVHVLTHGQVADGDASVYLLGSDTQAHDDADVARWLTSVQNVDGRPLTLFLLDLCQSGTAARLPWQSAARGPLRGWVIAASRGDRPAYDGRFTRAVISVLRDLAAGGLGVDPSVEHVPLDVVAKAIRREVNRLAAAEDAYPQQVTASLVDMSAGVPDLPFFPNPAYQDDSRTRLRAGLDPALRPFLDDLDEGLDARHFVERAAGVGPLPSAASELRGCFTGRAEELRKLSPWLSGEGSAPLHVVTGSPGAGKSALLGVLVCAAHPVLRGQTRPLWGRIAQRPLMQQHLAAVHARRRDVAAVVGSLARQLGLVGDGMQIGGDGASASQASRGDAGFDGTAREFVTAVAALPQRPVIVVDALDEADDGITLMNSLLLPLAVARRPDGGAAVRLLVGVRRYEEYAPLLDAAKADDGYVDLDDVPADVLEDDLHQYVSELLRADGHWRHKGAHVGAFAAEVARVLSEQAADSREWGEFLVAGLYTRYLLTIHPEPPGDPAEATATGTRAPRTLPEVLELDLDAHFDVPPLRHVITVLGHARGQGMPLTVLTRLVPDIEAATADSGNIFGHDLLADQPVSTVQAVQQALQAGRFYLRQSTDVDGSTLYRLFHQGLSDHLRRTPWPRLSERLLAALGPPGHRNWQAAEPYVIRHALDHATEEGDAEGVLNDPGYLLQADPEVLLPLMTRTLGDVYCASLDTSAGSPQVNRATLALNAARAGLADLARAVVNLPGEAVLSWQPRWVAGVSGVVVERRKANSRKAALPYSGLVVVSRSPGGPLVTWDLATRERIGEPVPCETPVWSIGQLNDSLAAVTCGNDGSLRIWDLLTQKRVGAVMTGHGGPVSAIAVGDLEGRAVAVTGGQDGTVRVWDLMTQQQVGDALAVHDGPVHAMAIGEFEGRTAALTGGMDGSVRIQDLLARQQINAVTAPGEPVHALAVGELEGRTVVVIVRENRGAQVVDLKRRKTDELTTRSGDMSPVVAVGELDGRAVAATGGRDGTIQIWDLATRQPVGKPMTGHQRTVVSVALGEADGHSVAVTGALDGTMRIWDLTTRRSVHIRLGGRLERVSTSPIVRLATRQDDSGEATRQDDSGEAARQDDSGEADDWASRVARARDRLAESSAGPMVRSLTIASLPAFPAALLGSDDGNVSVVDLAAGKPCLEVQRVIHSAGSLSFGSMTTGSEATPRPDGPGAAAPDAAPWSVTAITCDQIAGHPVALVTIGGRTSMILDLDTGQWVKTGTISDRLMVGGPKPPSALILISGSLARVVGGEDGTITVQDDTSTQSLPGKHDGPVTAVACQHLADRPLAFTGGHDGKVRVWDLAARQLLDVIDVTGPVFAIEATGDGDLLVGAGGGAISFQHANFVPGRSGAPRRRATGRKPPSRLAGVVQGGQR